MVGTARVRVRKISRDGGYSLIGTTKSASRGNTWSSYESNSDVVGNPLGNNPLRLEKTGVLREPLLNNQSYSFATYHDWVPSCGLSYRAEQRSMNYDRTIPEAIKDSHPGNPKVSIPNFIYELKDLPEMLMHFIKTMKRLNSARKSARDGGNPPPPSPKEYADGWLAYNFGWAPLVSDLKNIYDVAEGVARSARRYHKAITEGFVSTTGRRGESTDTFISLNVPFDTAYGGVFATKTAEVYGRAWVTSRWKATPNLPLYALLNGGHRDLLLDNLGLDISPEEIWDAIPWSWLVDWCTDASSVIFSYQNQGGFSYIGSTAMEYQKSLVTFSPRTRIAEYSLNTHNPNVEIESELKLRTVTTPITAGVSVNIFTGHQLSILAALLIGGEAGLARRT